MTRLSGSKGVTKWLRTLRPGVAVTAPEAVTVTLSHETETDLTWYGPTRQERAQAPLTAREIVGTQRAETRAKKKSKRSKRA